MKETDMMCFPVALNRYVLSLTCLLIDFSLSSIFQISFQHLSNEEVYIGRLVNEDTPAGEINDMKVQQNYFVRMTICKRFMGM